MAYQKDESTTQDDQILDDILTFKTKLKRDFFKSNVTKNEQWRKRGEHMK